jgi:class 3 adenylate cyclase/tetratricopeptide (TPR) repeat protein
MVTLLFTDLVNSTALLQRAGDEQAQRILRVHHRLLKEAVAANGGHTVKWLGDGLMVAFPSAADAVCCAIAMQQAARRPVAGERLILRVGLNAGEALREETDYFGTPVVVARRLCEHAAGRQILCSTVVSGLLASRPAFAFRDCGTLEIKGLAAPIATCEVIYEHDEPALLARTPFVGRAQELERLQQKLHDTRAGRGGLVMLVGEPGIGKTRTAEEIAERACYAGVQVLWGRCYEGDWAPRYAPFAEALAAHAATADAEELRADLGPGAPPLTRLVPALRQRLPDIPEPITLPPDEERFRVLDTVSQVLIALSVRTPVLLVLDDLHWADRGTVALLRHIARFAPRHRLLVLGTYRDVEVDGAGAFAEALRALPRDTSYEHLKLEGLDAQEVEQLLEMIADHEVPDTFASAIRTETSGNPFFIREVLLELVSEKKVIRQEGRWTSALSLDELRIPEGVRQVIGRRLARLSADAKRLLPVAAAFNGLFRFDIAAAVAGLDEAHGLSAVEEALAAQMLCPGSSPDTYIFTHVLIRHTLYGELSPSRQVRLHRQIAEAMERAYDNPSTGAGQSRVGKHAAEVAYQYQRSAALPGAERGVAHALAAVDRAEAAYAHDDAVTFLRMALELLLHTDVRRPRLLGRLGTALGWALNFDEALRVMRQAGDLIAAAEGADPAADYLAGAAMELWGAGFQRGACALAAQGLSYIGERRDITWVRLMANDISRREVEDPQHAGIMVDTPERRAMVEITERLSFPRSEEMLLGVSGFLAAKSRTEILGRFSDVPFWLMMGAGEYRRSLPLWEDLVAQSQREGRIADVVAYSAQLARCHNALGNSPAARTAYDRGAALAGRLSGSFCQTRNLSAARYDMQTVVDDGWEDFIRERQVALQQPVIENNGFLATACAVGARVYARLGRTEEALLLLGTLLPRLERAPGWAVHYTFMACEAATALWLLERTDHIDVIERSLREKVLVPDFRRPMVDARLSMAHLCALQRRYDEAVDWFAQARAVLDAQGARPLRAIVDFDEALMYHRRAAAGDTDLMQRLLEPALQQFRALQMTGWVKRAEGILQPGRTRPPLHNTPLKQPDRIGDAEPHKGNGGQTTAYQVFRKDGDYWTLVFEGHTARLKDAKGLHYISHLLRHPGRELHARDLVALVDSAADSVQASHGAGEGELVTRSSLGNAGALLDGQAKADYKRRLEDLRVELDEAERFNDPGRAARAREEIGFVTNQLAAAIGLGGRDRVAASNAERARLAVTKRIKAALVKIRHANPALARHLARAITTGYFCCYAPTVDTVISWLAG